MRLGEILVERGHISLEEVDRALELQRERGDKIGKILVDLGYIAAREVLSALSEQLATPSCDSMVRRPFRRKPKSSHPALCASFAACLTAWTTTRSRWRWRTRSISRRYSQLATTPA